MSQGLEARIGYAVKRVQQSLRAAGDRALRPVGLTLPQYAVLTVLAEGSAASSSELARRSFVTRQTMNQLLAGLMRDGLVARAAQPQDGRALPVRLTDAGRERGARGTEVLAAVEERMVEGLDAAERARLLDLLLTCADNLDGAVTNPTNPARP